MLPRAQIMWLGIWTASFVVISTGHDWNSLVTSDLEANASKLNAIEPAQLESTPNSSEVMYYDNKCTSEPETEYYGKSFRDLKVEDPGECCDACQKDLSCNAWTYRWFYAKSKPKTCWLMKGAMVVDKVRTHRHMTSGIREYRKIPFASITFENGIDYQEKNLYTVKIETAKDCADFCAKKLLCKAFTYNTKTKSCYAKRGTWGKLREESMVSGVVW